MFRRNKISRRKFLISASLSAFAVLLLDAFWFERRFVKFNEFSLNPDKTSAGIKIVQISDLHLKNLGAELKDLADEVNQLQPDFIVFTGDAVENVDGLSVLDALLQEFDKNIVKVAILGNWEYWGGVDISSLKNLYAKYNCELLVNQNKQYSVRGKTVSIIGVDDLLGGAPNIDQAIQSIQQSDYHIVLNHCPAYSDVICDYLGGTLKIDVILSGHTHGGQVNIFGFIPFLPQGSGRYVKGWYDLKHTKMYVSKGIGTSLLPIRFGARAEVAIFNL